MRHEDTERSTVARNDFMKKIRYSMRRLIRKTYKFRNVQCLPTRKYDLHGFAPNELSSIEILPIESGSPPKRHSAARKTEAIVIITASTCAELVYNDTRLELGVLNAWSLNSN